MTANTARRDNTGKTGFVSQLVHFKPALESWVAHIEAGREKYPDVDGVPNWTLGGKPNEEYLDAIVRHVFKIAEGEVFDGETGTKHTAAVMWNAAALDVLNQCNTNIDWSGWSNKEAAQDLGLDPRA